MNEYAHIPPPPPSPPGWVPYRGAPGLVPPAAAGAPYAVTAAVTAVVPGRRAHRGWVVVTSVVALGASIFGVAALTQHDDAASGSPLAAAIEGTQAQKTARIDVTVDAPGLPEPFATSAEVDFEAGVSHLTMDLSALAGLGDAPAGLGTGPVEVLTKGSVVYLKVGGFELFGGAAKWLKLDASAMPGAITGSSAPPVATLDASELLDLLKQQADSFTEVGRESVRGVDTTHYTAVIDVAGFASDHASALDDPSLATKIRQLDGTTATFDVWIDGDDLVRKLVVHTESSEGAATITIEFYDFGKPVDATIPADADTIDLTAFIGTR